MCGIAGVIRLDGRRVDPAPLGAMLDTIAHRGPNGRGTWSHGPFALGHVRLSVIDLSADAHQPMLTPDGQGVLVYNGEVYNFPALRAELEGLGEVFESHGDSEVVLRALHRFGPEAAVPRFDGMFALAYVDLRDDAVWLARDRVGIKNLSLAERDGHLVFGSEAKALLAHPLVPVRLDRTELAHQVLYNQSSWRHSLFEGVSSLPRGTLLRVRDGVRTELRFHDVLASFDARRAAGHGAPRPEDVVRTVERELTASVRSHLVSDAPLATMCSGGVDSSLLTALVKDERPDLEAFVADVGGRASEWSQAERVGAHLGVPLHRIELDRTTYLRNWVDAVWHRDLPVFHPSDPAMLAVTRACRDRGFRVLLTGEGADEVFGGYGWYRRGFERWRKLRRRSRLPWLFPSSARQWRKVRDLPHLLVPARGDAVHRFRLLTGIAPGREVGRARIQEHLASVEPPEARTFLAMQLDDMQWHLAWILYRHDRIGMAASIESRVPFLANDLVAYGLDLPVAVKYRDRQLKWAVKQVAERRLPKAVVHAPKKGFPVPSTLHGGTIGLLEGGRVPELLRWSRDESRRIVAAVRERRARGFGLVNLELWARLFLDDTPPGEVAEQLLAAAGARPEAGGR